MSNRIGICPILEEILALKPYDEPREKKWQLDDTLLITTNSDGTFTLCQDLDLCDECWFNGDIIDVDLLQVALLLGLQDLVYPPSWEELGFKQIGDHTKHYWVNNNHKIAVSRPGEGASYNSTEWIINFRREINVPSTERKQFFSFDNEFEARKYCYQLLLCYLFKQGITA